ncbi:MAG: O-methyltransferase [Burkholderiales bacterium]|nr:O-methyltransferase [Anaerolineae bacterium]
MADLISGSQLEQLERYVTDLFAQEDDGLLSIHAEIEHQGLPKITIDPFEGRLLQFLLTSIGARKVVEIGTLAGYSGVWIARALPADGKLYTLEKSGKHAAIARASFERAGVSDKTQVIEGAALDTLAKLSSEGPFDFVFIDADKGTYGAYLNWALDNLRSGGMVAAHNAFRAGKILAPENEDDRLIDQFNRQIAAEPRLFSTIIGVGDGMAVGIKK